MRSSPSAALVASFALALPLVASADSHQNDNRGRNDYHQSGVLRIALWGDEFYNNDPNEKARQIEQTIGSMNRHHLDFTFFVGDTKNGSTLCTDDAIWVEPQLIFNSLDVPTVYSLGDNEWTDCHRTSNGSYDPLERLAFLRQRFFSTNYSQGYNPIRLQRQGELGEAYSENSRFVRKRVEFVAIHIPGSNNNLVATDSQCTKKSNRGPADCAAATAEYVARNARNVEWLKASFDEAREHHLAGIMIGIQADIYFPVELSDGGYEEAFLPTLTADNGYTDFFNTLVEETHNFDGQVLLVHGDSHYFKMDKAMVDPNGRITPNFTRIEVFGSSDNSWVEMTVDPDSKNVFSFEPVVLE